MHDSMTHSKTGLIPVPKAISNAITNAITNASEPLQIQSAY